MSQKKISIRIKPEILYWARCSVGLTINEVVQKIKYLDEKQFSNWEKIESEIPFNTIRKLAKVYKRPTAVFFLEKVPNDPPIPKNFRTHPIGENQYGEVFYSYKTLLTIRKANRIQSLASDIIDDLELGIGYKNILINLNQNPEVCAENIRKRLNVSIKNQFLWKDANEALINWKQFFENLGILVCELKMKTEEIRGFTIHSHGGKPPVIVLNFGDSTVAKSFSLFHEFGHLLLKENGIEKIDNTELIFNKSIINIEKFCNAFAASFLVPKDNLLNHPLVKNNLSDKPLWRDYVLSRLAKKFKVSKEVILRRLLTYGLTTESFYNSKRKEWLLLERKKKKGGGIGRNMPKEIFRENGKTFSSLVLESFNKGKISISDVCDYLGTKTKYINEIKHYIKTQ